MKTLIGLLTLLMASHVQAFTLASSTSQSFRGWANPEIRFQLNPTNCPANVDINGIIGEAFDLWNSVPTSRVHLSLVGTTTSTTHSDPITIYCDTNYGAGSSATQNGSPGAASVLPTGGDEITSGIMYLNATGGNANIGRLSRDLVAITLAHEIGHLLGLGHSQDGNALMYYNAGAKNTMSLAQDDIDGVTYLYPRDEMGSDKPLGCALVKALPPPPPGSSGLLVALGLLPVLTALWLRGRRRRVDYGII